MDMTRIDRLARKQHLLVTKAQAMEAGVSERMWYRRLERGGWTELHPGVAALPGAPDTSARQILAAVLAVGGDARASHASAAWAWVGEPEPKVVDVLVTSRGRHPDLIDVRVHRPRDLADLTSSRRHGIAVTNPLRTLIDLGASEDPPAVAAFLELSLVAGWFAMPAARSLIDRHARKGRDGVGALRQVLDEWKLGDRPPDSVLEVRVSDLFARYQLDGAEFQRPINSGGRLFIPDFTFVPQRVMVEVLGWSDHGSRSAFERDPERVAILTAAGFIVLEFTWLQVTRRPGWVAARIAEVLALRSAV
jgi:very-short-patch-repair endonuclease